MQLVEWWLVVIRLESEAKKGTIVLGRFGVLTFRIGIRSVFMTREERREEGESPKGSLNY